MKTDPRTRSLDGETAVAVARPGAGNSQSNGVKMCKVLQSGAFYLFFLRQRCIRMRS